MSLPEVMCQQPDLLNTHTASYCYIQHQHLHTNNTFCPFSIGPRGCIGKGLAYVELTVTIARVLFLYDVRLAPGTTLGAGSKNLEAGRNRPTEYQIEDRFASTKDGPVLQFRARES